LRIGMIGNVEVAVSGGPAALLIPRSSVQHVGDRTVVYLVAADQPGTFIEREVRLGDTGGEGSIAVLTGLVPGDSVVSDGSFALRAESERLGLRARGSNSATNQSGPSTVKAAVSLFFASLQATMTPAAATTAVTTGGLTARGLQPHPWMNTALVLQRAGAIDALTVGATRRHEVIGLQSAAFRRHGGHVRQLIEQRHDPAAKLGDFRKRVGLTAPIGRDKRLADTHVGVGRREVPGTDEAEVRELSDELIEFHAPVAHTRTCPEHGVERVGITGVQHVHFYVLTSAR
jgi:hypothetical protein